MMTPQKYPQNLYAQKIFIYLKNPKNIENQKFEPQKVARAYVCMNISEYPPSGIGYPFWEIHFKILNFNIFGGTVLFVDIWGDHF